MACTTTGRVSVTTGATGSSFDRGPRCRDRAIRAEALEHAVWDEVCALLTSEDRLLALADEYLGLRETQVEVEQDESRTLDAQIRKVERALKENMVEAVKAGYPAEVIRAGTEELTRELHALRARREMVEEWKREGEQQSQRVQRLVELADVARDRLPEMSLSEKVFSICSEFAFRSSMQDRAQHLCA
jgi:hypothetical protein